MIFDGNDSTEASCLRWRSAGRPRSRASTTRAGNGEPGPARLRRSGAGRRLAGDDFEDGAVVVNGTTIVAQGAIFNGDPSRQRSAPPGTEPAVGHGVPIDITSGARRPAPTRVELSRAPTRSGDCLSLIAAIVNLPAGAAPPPGRPGGRAPAAPRPGVTTSTLNGTVDPNGEATSYRFQYGKTAAYGAQTSLSSVHSGSERSAGVGQRRRARAQHDLPLPSPGLQRGAGRPPGATARSPPPRRRRRGVLGSTAQSPAPVARRTVVLREVSGTVLVKRPGSRRFVPLSQLVSVPVGSQVDTRKGRVELTSAAELEGQDPDRRSSTTASSR